MLFQNFMTVALQAAKCAAKIGEIPVGAVVVNHITQKVIAISSNKTRINHDPLAHAEIIALRSASLAIGKMRLYDCSLYTTLEPCAMCAGAISLYKVGRLYIGAEDIKYGSILNGPKLYSTKNQYLNHIPEYYSGIMNNECVQILKDFFRSLRVQHKNNDIKFDNIDQR